MIDKKIITGDFRDPTTGIRFVEDDRGIRYCVMEHDMHVVVEYPEKPPKHLHSIIESLRKENNWLWEQVSTVIRDKKMPKKAIENLEKAVKERKRL